MRSTELKSKSTTSSVAQLWGDITLSIWKGQARPEYHLHLRSLTLSVFGYTTTRSCLLHPIQMYRSMTRHLNARAEQPGMQAKVHGSHEFELDHMQNLYA